MRRHLAILILSCVLPAVVVPGVCVAQVRDGEAAPGEQWLDAQDLAVRTDSLTIDDGALRIQLSGSFLVDPIVVELDGTTLVEDTDFGLDRTRGQLVLVQRPRPGARLVVRFHYDPAASPPRVVLHPTRVSAADEGDAEAESVAPAAPDPMPGSIEALRRSGALQVSGSKTISIQGGTNREATVDQALVLTVGGMLSDNIGVRAQISDQNLPIVPEGTTEELKDLDQVRIELFGPRGKALMGDFELNRRLGVFVPYNRKLQGLELEGIDDRGRVGVLAGSPRGRRVELEFFGVEGLQGPYELLDPLREDGSYIVAGSERVWIDGEQMVRGESRDYTIDYIQANVRFTPQRRVGPEHRIAVDFEIFNTAYANSVVGALADSIKAGPLRFHASWLREGDDPDRPSAGPLTAEDRDVLADAGDDPLSALGGGVIQVPPGEEGTGDYARRDSLGTIFYEYAKGDPDADYFVSFFRVGSGRGDYQQSGVTNAGQRIFEFVGDTIGEHRIGRPLPLPARTTATVVGVGMGSEGRGGRVSAELDLTEHDANTLSPLDDEDNQGTSWRMEAVSPRIGGEEAEEGARMTVLAESIDADFYELGRLRSPFFYDAWNLQNDPRKSQELHATARMDVRLKSWTSDASLSKLERRGAYDGRRARWEAGGPLLAGLDWSHRLAWTSAQRSDSTGASANSDRRNRMLRLGAKVFGARPYGRVADESWADGPVGDRRGFRYEEWAVGMRAAESDRGRIEYRRRLADSLDTSGTTWKFDSDVRELTGRGGAPIGDLRVNLEGSYRETRLPQETVEVSRLGRMILGYRPSGSTLGVDLDYRAGTDNSRLFERRIVFVGEGLGDFDINGNPVGKGQGDYNVIIQPGDSTVATTDVKLTTKFDWDWREGVLGGMSINALLDIEEKSESDDVPSILLLSPSVIRDPAVTLFGRQQGRLDLGLLRKLRHTDLRVTLDDITSLDRRFSVEPERIRSRTRRVKLDRDLGGGWTVGLDGGDLLRSRQTSAAVTNFLSSYDIDEVFAGGTLRYRPAPRTRISLRLSGTRRADALSGIEQDVAEVLPGLTTDFLRGRWTVELRLADVREAGEFDPVSRPFLLEAPGTNRRASIVAQWGGRGLLNLTVRYELRDEFGRPTRQDLTVETRARF